MKTTLVISDAVMENLREEARRRNCTMSALVEEGLRLLLDTRPQQEEPPPLPSFSGGEIRVNIANREALYDFMEQ